MGCHCSHWPPLENWEKGINHFLLEISLREQKFPSRMQNQLSLTTIPYIPLRNMAGQDTLFVGNVTVGNPQRPSSQILTLTLIIWQEDASNPSSLKINGRVQGFQVSDVEIWTYNSSLLESLLLLPVLQSNSINNMMKAHCTHWLHWYTTKTRLTGLWWLWHEWQSTRRYN